MKLSKIFDFPFSIPRLNGYLDFYGRFLSDSIRRNLNHSENGKCLLDIGAGSQKYRQMVESLNLRYKSCDLPGSPNEDSQDFLCDASRLTAENSSYDFCLHVQVLEHLQSPQMSINEVARVLKPGGKLLLATNFLYPIHGEPNDYFRFTKFGLENLLENSGMKLLSIEEIGGLYKFLSTSLQYQRDFFFRSRLIAPDRDVFRVLVTPLRLCINLGIVVIIVALNKADELLFLPKYTSGYFVVAEKF
jgi:SAM-dependent methyltransferase